MAEQIESTEFYDRGDTLIWSPSVNGEITFKSAYNVCRTCGPSFSGMSCIWQKHIPPRRSVVGYRALRNRLPTEI